LKNGFGAGSCSFSGFQPYKTANFKVAFPKLQFWESNLEMKYIMWDHVHHEKYLA
jgi:hypothetical protein